MRKESREDRIDDRVKERMEERIGEDGTIGHVSAFGFVDPITLKL